MKDQWAAIDNLVDNATSIQERVLTALYAFAGDGKRYETFEIKENGIVTGTETW